jgi:hypothetical protein
MRNDESLNDERVLRCFRFDIWASAFVIPSSFVIRGSSLRRICLLTASD